MRMEEPNELEKGQRKMEKLTLVKKIAKISVWIFCIVGLSILFMKTLSRHNKLSCSKIDLKLENSGGFIDENDLINEIKTRFKIINKPCESINLLEIEQFVKTNPFVRSSDLFFDLKGVLHVSVLQKIPALRVTNNLGEKFIVDEQGLKMPVPPESDSSLIQIDGEVRERLVLNKHSQTLISGSDDSLKTNSLKLAYGFWKRIQPESSTIQKIKTFHIQSDNSISIYLKNLDLPLVFGDTSHLGEKLEKMDIFTSTILPKMGTDTYSKVDLRFSHEWVCEKKNKGSVKDTLSNNRKINKLI